MKVNSENLIPVFQLYGEIHVWPTPDLLHCESIAARSRRHDWYIKPHRHSDLLHILEVRSGSVSLELDGEEFHFSNPVLFVIPSMTIHGFRFSRDVDGSVITLAKPLTDLLSSRFGAEGALFSEVSIISPSPEGAESVTVGLIEREYAQPAPKRNACIEGLIQALTIMIMRRKLRLNGDFRGLQKQSNDHAEMLLQRYQALIENQYDQQPNVQELAAVLGETRARLNAVCRKLVKKSALELIHDRIILQAKRELTYTSMTISQVSDSLGFSEAAYFTRFFKRVTGQTPKMFRKRHLM